MSEAREVEEGSPPFSQMGKRVRQTNDGAVCSVLFWEQKGGIPGEREVGEGAGEYFC